jgi:hypothetical protein
MHIIRKYQARHHNNDLSLEKGRRIEELLSHERPNFYRFLTTWKKEEIICCLFVGSETC